MRTQLRDFFDSHAGAEALGVVVLLPMAIILFGLAMVWYKTVMILGLGGIGSDLRLLDVSTKHFRLDIFTSRQQADQHAFLICLGVMVAGYLVMAWYFAALQWVHTGRFSLIGYWRRAVGPQR
jgi:hypothetical protein